MVVNVDFVAQLVANRTISVPQGVNEAHKVASKKPKRKLAGTVDFIGELN